jgi:hypothetical protein
MINLSAVLRATYNSKLNFVLITALMLVILPCSTMAGWTVNEEIDSMTDATKKKATITNAEGHIFSIYRVSPGGKVWGLFRLSPESLDLLATDHLPMFRVDKNDPNDLMDLVRVTEIMQRLKTPMTFYTQEPKWINFQLWPGDNIEGICGSSGKKFAEILNGKNLVIRYWLFAGGFKETEFDIHDGKEPILKAIDSQGVKICS